MPTGRASPQGQGADQHPRSLRSGSGGGGQPSLPFRQPLTNLPTPREDVGHKYFHSVFSLLFSAKPRHPDPFPLCQRSLAGSRRSQLPWLVTGRSPSCTGPPTGCYVLRGAEQALNKSGWFPAPEEHGMRDKHHHAEAGNGSRDLLTPLLATPAASRGVPAPFTRHPPECSPTMRCHAAPLLSRSRQLPLAPLDTLSISRPEVTGQILTLCPVTSQLPLQLSL